jgi:PEGA domain
MNRHATILLGFLLIAVAWAHAATKNAEILTIKVMSATTESIPLNTDSNGVPKDCGIMDYSAYCHHSRSAIVRHTMLVQDSNGQSFTISCTVDSIWSKCIDLPAGAVFTAQRTRRGITIWYPNAKGREVKQFYARVSDADKPSVTSRPHEDATAANIADNSTAAAASETNRDAVRCNFASTPSGAEITIDGKYVGNAPSAIAVDPGTHLVVLSMPGFAKWKRELTVYAGSDVDVSATLQKTRR